MTKIEDLVKLFYGDQYYPLGGYGDFHSYFDNIDLAKKYVESVFKNEACTWAHMVLHDRIVLRGRNDSNNDGWEWSEVAND